MAITIDLAGRVAIVTGGGTGLGKAAARALVEAGASVCVVGRRPGVTSEAAAEVGASPIAADISDESAVRALVKRVTDEHGRLDILVNAAGIIAKGSAYDMTMEDFDRQQAVNVRGTFLCCQAAGREMRKAGYGKIVNVGSIASEIGTPMIAAYAGTKGAIRQLTKSLAAEWATDGIRVNAILPGWFRTEMSQQSFGNPEWVARIRGRIPGGMEAMPADIEGTVLYLASPMSDYVTGVALPVDGGALAW